MPSRQEVGQEHNDYGHPYTRSLSQNSNIIPNHGSRRNSIAASGLSYEDIVKGSGGNTLKPTKKISRADSRMSMTSNITSKWKEDLHNYQAMKITIFKNGDQWFDGFELRFIPSRDFQSLEAMMARISPKIAFTSSVAFLFDTDGNPIKKLDDLEDGQSYVASNTKKFVHANYGRTGEAFWPDGNRGNFRFNGFRRRSVSSKSSSSDSKPGSGEGRVIKIINNEDTSIFERVLLNLRTTQAFEEVVKDLGEVIRMKGADRMYNLSGREVKSFSHLRNEFFDDEVFAISSGPSKVNKSIYTISRNVSAVSNKKAPQSATRNLDSGGNGNFKILIKGVRRVYHTPSGVIKENNRVPDHKLDLEWVYGYNGSDKRQNLLVLSKGDLVYNVGAVVVIYNRMDEKQLHYTEHTEDVQCIDLHPKGIFIASGQKAGETKDSKSHIRVWSSTTLETLKVLGFGECENGINGVAFSALNNGLFLAAVDNSKEKILSVWDWDKDSLMARVVTKAINICGLSFHPFDNNLIITFGTRHLCFWSRKKDSFFDKVNVVEKDSENITFQTLAFLESGDLIVGDSDGFISSYSVTNDGEYFESFRFNAHDKGVSCIIVMVEGTVISAGQKDGTIKAWDMSKDFTKIYQTDLQTSGSAVTICPQWPGKPDPNIYVGTAKNQILEGSLQRKFNIIIFGHTGELLAVATHPSDISFVTAGTDRFIACWRRTKLIWTHQAPSECESVCYNPQGTVVVLGTKDGSIVVVKAETGDPVTTTRICGSPITAIKFCLDGDLVAAASQNGSIYVYKVSRDGFSYKKHGKITGGQKLTHLDWDEDSEFLQTCSLDFNLNFWNITTNKMEKVSSVLRDKTWVEQTCPVGWAVSGLWNNHNYKEDTTLSCVHVGQSQSIIVSGDTDGYIRLSRYPVTSPKAQFFQEKVVSGPIYSVRFFYDESYVIGVGGMDAGIFKWRVA